ncbi:unnamed protein product, partial [Rotaria socialis]
MTVTTLTTATLTAETVTIATMTAATVTVATLTTVPMAAATVAAVTMTAAMVTAATVTASANLQNIVLSKYQNGDTPTKNFRDLNGGIGLRTIKRWCQMILQSGSITLSSPPGCPRLARTKG